MKHKEETPATDAPETEAQTGHNGETSEAAVPPSGDSSAEVDKLRRDAQHNLEGWQRTLAEFQNYKRRTERETRDSYQNATVDVLKSILPIVDDFERAMSNVPESLQAEPWLQGVTLIQRKFTQLLNEYNVTAIDPVGEPFDPKRHEAIGMDDSGDMESGHVSTVLQKGYVAGEQVLRPAIVKVKG